MVKIEYHYYSTSKSCVREYLQWTLKLGVRSDQKGHTLTEKSHLRDSTLRKDSTMQHVHGSAIWKI